MPMAATGVIQLALTLGDLETGLILASTLAIVPAPSAWWTVNRWRARHQTPAPCVAGGRQSHHEDTERCEKRESKYLFN